MPIRQGSYGYRKGERDISEITSVARFNEIFPSLSVQPNTVELNKPQWISPCYDQGRSSSCVYNAWAAEGEYGLKRSGLADWTPSRLFGYWNGRFIEGDTNEDAGSYVHDAFHQMRFVGMIPESLWPFSDDFTRIVTKPTQNCFDEAKKIQPKDFASLNTLEDMITCLAHGFPFCFGFRVPEIFESVEFSKNPNLHLPSFGTRYVGGHGVCAMGYDKNRGQGLIRNSWSTDWGEDGYFWMDFEMLQSPLVTDKYMLRFPNQQRSLQ